MRTTSTAFEVSVTVAVIAMASLSVASSVHADPAELPQFINPPGMAIPLPPPPQREIPPGGLMPSPVTVTPPANHDGLPPGRMVDCGNGTTIWAPESRSRMSACLGGAGMRRHLRPSLPKFNGLSRTIPARRFSLPPQNR